MSARAFALLLCGIASLVLAEAADTITIIGGNASPPPPNYSTASCYLGVDFRPIGWETQNSPYWAAENQTLGGNTVPDQMVDVALSSWPAPVFHLRAVHYLLDANSSVPCSCWTSKGGSTTRRLSAAAQTCKDEAVVLQGAKYSVEFTMTGPTNKTSERIIVGNYYNNASDTTLQPPQIQLEGLQKVPDGRYCLNILLRLAAGSALVQVSASGSLRRLPDSEITLSRKVCFVKVDNAPVTDIIFQSCTRTFAIEVPSIRPAPIWTASGSTKPLLVPVVDCWGQQNGTIRNASITWDSTGWTSADNDKQQWVKTRMVFTSPNVTSAEYNMTNLQDGFYLMGCQTAFTSSFGSLMGLYGPDVFEDGTPKWLGKLLNNGSQFGLNVQSKESEILQISGPDSLDMTNDVTFTWKWTGYGAFSCKLDGQPFTNKPEYNGGCYPPVYSRLADTLNHTLQIAFTDVCGGVKTKDVIFGAWGWYVNDTSNAGNIGNATDLPGIYFPNNRSPPANWGNSSHRAEWSILSCLAGLLALLMLL